MKLRGQEQLEPATRNQSDNQQRGRDESGEQAILTKLANDEGL
jgi:hypothetical protein